MVATASTPAVAQAIPGLPSLGRAPAAAAAPTAEPTAEELLARLDAARAEHRQLLAQPDGSAPLLAQRQLASARRLVLLTARVDALRTRSAVGKSSESLAAEVTPLAGPPPYSLLEVDRLRDQLETLTNQQTALQLRLKSLDASIESDLRARDDASVNLRLRRESIARRIPGGDPGTAQAELELAEITSQEAELELVQTDEARRQARDKLAALSEPIAQLQAEIERVRTQVQLDEATLRKLLAGIAAERKQLGTEEARLAERLARRESETTGSGAFRGPEVEALSQTMRTLGTLESLLRTAEVLWQNRQKAIDPHLDAGQRYAMAEKLDQGLRLMQEQRRRLAEEDRLVRADLRRQQAYLLNLAGDPIASARERRVLEALQLQSDARERLSDGIDRLSVLAIRTRSDLGLGAPPSDAGEWLNRVGVGLSRALAAVWHYELFSATETRQIDGRAVTVDYGVTVGKSVGALVMLALGYWFAGWLSRAVIRLIGTRVEFSPQQARVLSRWVNSILVLAVLLLVLKLARIPLTAFAFLGGALAIGVGFGAQNVIKNLISGVIILFERKIRVGDIVSIGGVAGTVLNVDLRATTVRGFDGIDAIVPNSNLLENQISNWSGGSPDIRRAIVVGVAYGSDMRKAAQVITDCAAVHASVLKQPAPEALFSDFGSDNLALTLLYWTRLGGARGGPSVDSDLRFAIADALKAAGIGIAFPQRDVHFDMAGPLRVELSGAAAPAPTPRGPQP